jgi:hypothetical protein
VTAEIYAGAVWTGNCTIGFFKNFSENLSCLRAASRRKTQSSGRLHVRYKEFPYIRLRASGPWGMNVRTVDL